MRLEPVNHQALWVGKNSPSMSQVSAPTTQRIVRLPTFTVGGLFVPWSTHCVVWISALTSMNCAAVDSKGEPQLASTANKRAFEIGWLLMCLEPRETKRERFSMGGA